MPGEGTKQAVRHKDEVVAWRLMILALSPTTKELEDWCKDQNADLPRAKQMPYVKQAPGLNYHEALLRHLLLTMHNVGFMDLQLLGDKAWVKRQNYSMLWREAVFRGIRPVANSAVLHARMFDESKKNSLELLPRMQTVQDLPLTPGCCNGNGGVQPRAHGSKRSREKQDKEDDFQVKGASAKPAEEVKRQVKKALIAKAANPNPNPNPNANPNPDPNPNPNPNPNRKHTH